MSLYCESERHANEDANEDTTARWIAARRTFACPQQAEQARQTLIRQPVVNLTGAGASLISVTSLLQFTVLCNARPSCDSCCVLGGAAVSSLLGLSAPSLHNQIFRLTSPPPCR